MRQISIFTDDRVRNVVRFALNVAGLTALYVACLTSRHRQAGSFHSACALLRSGNVAFHQCNCHFCTLHPKKNMKRITLILFLLGLSLVSLAQKAITLEDIWQNYTFWPESTPGFNFQQDGVHYSLQEGNQIVQYDLRSGEQTAVLFDLSRNLPSREGGRPITNFSSYAFSADEHKILIATEVEPIYRHSTRANYYVYDGKALTPLFEEGKQRYATFSPQGDKVAFVYHNDLYYKDLNSGEVRRITTDGRHNAIINGATDWVYEEEFSFARAFQWAPDGSSIAYYRFDESEVPEYTMTLYHDQLYPEYETFKYPKVGQKNSEVRIFVYHLAKAQSVEVALDTTVEFYVPRIKWTQDPHELCVFYMNRHQNDLKLFLADAATGQTRLLLHEENRWYIDIHDNLTFLKDGQRFLWTSEQSGYNHIYLYDMQGNLLRQISSGKWEVTDFYGLDEETGLLYFQATEGEPLRRGVYSMPLKGGKKKALHKEAGWNSATFSSTFDYYVLKHATANTPPVYEVYNRKAKKVRSLVDNKALRQMQQEYAVQPVEFFSFKTPYGVDLNGYMIKPPDFDPNKKYPLFMYVYGGPGAQTVTDNWGGQNYWWFQMLAQQGFVVVSVDNRGTGGRGEEFKKMTYLQLGKYEVQDQIAAAQYLAEKPFINADKIGIFGWSYGGYMSSLCILKGSDVFSYAIAVAPVTNWKWYDTIYTERYMRTTEENPDGYRDNSPVYFADRLKGRYLLIHGMGDDNVHFQHSVEMVNALVNANKQFESFFYPNKNHGIYGGPTRLNLFTKMTNFLGKELE